jgi:AraC-like DNA-binding protein
VQSSRASARVVRIRTDVWPERERAAMFREHHGRDFVRVEPQPGEPLRIDVMLVRFPNLGLLWGRRSPLRSDFADGSDRLLITLGGPAVATQFGRELLLERGDAVVFSGADRGSLTTVQSGGIATLEFPRGALLPLLDDARQRCARRIPKHSPALRLLRSYARAAHTNSCLDASSVPQLVIAHIFDLAALAVGAAREAQEIATGRGLRAARLGAIKQEVLAHLEHDLSIGEIAARNRLSPRYVGMLFESEGTTMTKFVREERLKRARAMLLSPRSVGRRIAEIAYAVGFNDVSYFNRSFRRRFGCSPSEIREMGSSDRSNESNDDHQ